jgi:hypothetical protein
MKHDMSLNKLTDKEIQDISARSTCPFYIKNKNHYVSPMKNK